MSTLRLYTKQALSISEQIELLKSRGLNIADSSKTAKFLGEVSYFRFVQYLRPMEADKTSHQFKPNSRFEDAVALYNFDMALRDLMFKAIQRLEIALRTKIIQEFSLEHGPFWFFDTSLADDERNCCAHHSRLWNRYLSTAPQMSASLRGAWVNIEGVDANKVYAIACCIAYWLDSMGYGLDFKNKLKSLLAFYSQVDPTAMGFPENWISEPLWR